MMASLFSLPVTQPLDENGAPMPGCYLRFYASGTTTPTDVYADADLNTPLSNPVVADSAGRFPPIYMDVRVAYRVQLYNDADELQFDVDPVFPIAGRFVGEVVMYDGDPQDIPAGWVLLNGDNDTIDARGRLPRCVGSDVALGDTGGAETADGETDQAGAHNHGGATDGHSLTEAELAAHHHRLYGSLYAIRSGGEFPAWYLDVGGGGAGLNAYADDGPTSTQMVEDAGDGDPHAHDIAGESDHTHTLTGLNILPPWFGIHFIKFVGPS